MAADRTYSAMVGSQAVDLPLVPLSEDLTIALLIMVDHGVAFAEVAGRELADLMRPAAPEIVVSVATMGIPLAIEASRAPARVDVVRGRRVAVVDDIISTGASTLAALRLVRRIGGEPVVIGTMMTEGSGWRTALGADADNVRSLGSMPLFRPAPDGSGDLVEDWD